MKLRYELRRTNSTEGVVELDAEDLAAYQAATSDEHRAEILSNVCSAHAADEDDWDDVTYDVDLITDDDPAWPGEDPA